MFRVLKTFSFLEIVSFKQKNVRRRVPDTVKWGGTGQFRIRSNEADPTSSGLAQWKINFCEKENDRLFLGWLDNLRSGVN